jgi:hypothetical protein
MTRTTKIKITDLQPGPFRWSPFAEEIRGILRTIRDNFREVPYPHSTLLTVEALEDGFRRDVHPEQEIALWLGMSERFREALDSGDYAPECARDLYALLLGYSVSGSIGDAFVNAKPLTHLSGEEAIAFLASATTPKGGET